MIDRPPQPPPPGGADEELVRRAQKGDSTALELLVQRKSAAALRMARHVVGDDDDAKDVVQLAFIRVWRKIGQYRAGSGFDPWFHRIVMNLAIDFRRRASTRHRKLRDLAAEPTAPATTGVMGNLRREEVRRIFDDLAQRLPPRQRAIFALREIEGLPGDEVARMLGVRPSTVRNHLFQARRALQQALRERYPEYAPGVEEDKG
jgi:RNA polymerase sigma-70 factor (ECF subfamily)